MKLILPAAAIERWRVELRTGGNREIGGVLIAEYMGEQTFRLAEFSRQCEAGTYTRFVRDDVQARRFVASYLHDTGKNPQQCNYIGEWHTHPLFSVQPSSEDITSMVELARDPNVGIGFAILIIMRLNMLASLQMVCVCFRSDGSSEIVEVEIDGANPDSWLRRFKKFFFR